MTIVDSTVDPVEVGVGETVNGDATLENIADKGDETVVVRMVVDGETVDSETVTVPAGETREVSLEHAFDAPGEYEVGIEGGVERTVTVTDGAAAAPSQGSNVLVGAPSGASWVYLLLLAIAVAALISAVRIVRE